MKKLSNGVLSVLGAAFIAFTSAHCVYSAKQKVSGKATFQDQSFDDLHISGSASLTRVNVSKVKILGSLNFDTLTVETKIEASGSVNGSGLRAQEGTFSGSIDLEDASLDSGDFSGSCTLSRAAIAEDLVISGTKTTLVDCSIRKIRIKPCLYSSGWTFFGFSWSSSENKTQRLYVQGSTTVDGDIVFESGIGEVYLDPNASIAGKVVGGTVTRN